jgi:hypothetical protein
MLSVFENYLLRIPLLSFISSHLWIAHSLKFLLFQLSTNVVFLVTPSPQECSTGWICCGY